MFLEECQRHLESVDVPEKHTLRISALNNLGTVYMRRGEPQEAVGLLERCLGLVEEVMGPDHVRMATTSHNLGACYMLLKRYEDAYPLYLRAWNQQVTLAGASNEWSLIFLRDLAQCAGFLGKREEHERYLAELVDQTHEHFGDNHYLMKAAIGQYRDFWPDTPDKITALRRRLADEAPWPESKKQVLLPPGSDWHYHTGSEPPATWNQPGFEPRDWNQGLAPLGYGESFITTQVPMGNDPERKWAGTYFVTSFTHSPNTSLAKLRLRARRDDGIAVFLNGTEILRQHLPPSSETTWKTYASAEVGGIEEELFYVTEIDPALLRQHNTLAAQVHQCNGNSSDLSFEMTIEALLRTDDTE